MTIQSLVNQIINRNKCITKQNIKWRHPPQTPSSYTSTDVRPTQAAYCSGNHVQITASHRKLHATGNRQASVLLLPTRHQRSPSHRELHAHLNNQVPVPPRPTRLQGCTAAVNCIGFPWVLQVVLLSFSMQ